MLMIRLARTGKTKQAYFRLIVSEKTKDTHGDYLEILGHVNPHQDPRGIELKADRVKYWLEHGAQVSSTVHNILVDQGLLKADKLKVWKPKKKAVEAVSAAEAKAETPAAAPAEKPKTEVAAEEPKAETPAEPAA